MSSPRAILREIEKQLAAALASDGSAHDLWLYARDVPVLLDAVRHELKRITPPARRAKKGKRK